MQLKEYVVLCVCVSKKNRTLRVRFHPQMVRTNAAPRFANAGAKFSLLHQLSNTYGSTMCFSLYVRPFEKLLQELRYSICLHGQSAAK